MKKVRVLVNRCLNRMLYYFFLLWPVNENYIAFQSVPDFCDNSYALFAYVEKEDKQREKKCIWFVGDQSLKQLNMPHVICVHKQNDIIDIKRAYYLARYKTMFCDHGNAMTDGHKRTGQVIVNLCHGTAVKAQSKYEPVKESCFDYVISTGEKATDGNAEFLNESKKKFLELGYPRNDYLFTYTPRIGLKIEEYGLSGFDKKFIWMPTFRQSEMIQLSQDYLSNETMLPLINTYDEMESLNLFLKRYNAVVVLKVHPLQADLPVFRKRLSNIRVIKNIDLQSMGIQLYQFLGWFDALITDYSSVYLDYILLNRPILFAISDIGEYNKTRGLIYSNMLDYLAGPHISDLRTMLNEMENVIKGSDEYAIKRENIVKLYYKYKDGNSSQRISDYFKLLNSSAMT